MNISIYTLSKETNIAYSTLNDICNGKVDIINCKINILLKLSKFFNIPMDKVYEICVNKNNRIMVDKYNTRAKTYTKNKKYYVRFKYDDEEINIKLCKVNKNNSEYIETIALWATEDYISEKELEKNYELQFNEKK